MRRRKRFTILRIAVALAAAAIMPVTAQAKPTPAGNDVGVTSAELGFAVGKSPDDRPYSRATSLETTPVVSDGGTSIDVSPYAVTGFGLVLLLAVGGMGIAIHHKRTAKLSAA